MIEIGLNKIQKNFGFKNVLNGFSTEIMTGERVGIVGRNGSGKSTVLKILCGEETADKGSVSIRHGATVGYLEQIPTLRGSDDTVRTVLMGGFADIFATEADMRDVEDRLATEADPDTLDKLLARYNTLQEKFIALDGYSVEERFAKIVNGFNLGDLLERSFNALSGGQKTIVNMACVILLQPDILLLDEPTNHLDLKTLEWFEDFLSRYVGTVVMISHDRFFLDKVTNKTIIVEAGECNTFHGNYSFAVKEQERLLLIEFEAFKTQQKKLEAMRAAVKRFREWGARGDNEKFYKKAHELEKRIEKMELIDKPVLEKAKISLGFKGARSGNDVMSVKNLHIAYGDNVLFDGAELSIFEKDRVCLMGQNGSGKTTLITAMLQSLEDFDNPHGFKTAPSAKIGYIPQEIRFENDKASVLEAFKYAHPCSELEARRALTGFFFYGEHVHKRVSSLSGGEKVLLKLAILIQNDINFLILDEPTNHIDIELREVLEEALLTFKGTLLFISHDRAFISNIATRIFEIEDKRVRMFTGDYESYREHIVRQGK